MAKTTTTKEAAKAAAREVTLNAEQLAKAAELLGGGYIGTADELMDKLVRSQQVRFSGGIDIELDTEDLWQLKQQAIGMNRNFDEYAKEFLEDSISLNLNGMIKARKY